MKEILKEAETKMGKTINVLDKELKSIRAGRANPAVLDKIMVPYFDVMTPISQMAAISVAEARVLVVQPWDKSTLKPIEKAIQASDIGINPVNDGTALRISFPPLTEERRKEIVKGIHKTGEESKVAIRSIRRDANETLKAKKKKSEISEDDLKTAEKHTQDLTDRFAKEIDALLKAKEQEILSI